MALKSPAKKRTPAREPKAGNKIPTVKFSITLAQNIIDQLEEAAVRKGMHRNALIQDLVSEGLEELKKRWGRPE